MRKMVGLILISVAAAWTASADEILYFKNGTTMPVRGHRVDGATVHVDLNSGAIAFPVEMIERIERAGKDVFVDPSGKTRANRVLDGGNTVTGDYSVAGRAPIRYSRDERPDLEADAAPPPIDSDDNGMAVYKPFRGQGGAKGKIAHTGSREVLSSPMITSKQNGILGTSRIGSRNTIGSTTPPGTGKRPRVIGLAARDASASEPPPQEDSGTPPPTDPDEE